MRALFLSCATILVFGACSSSGSGEAGDPVTGDPSTTTGGPTVPGPGNMSVNLGGEDSSCKPDAEVHNGEGTYYTFADGGGNCGFPPTPNDLMVGAMNHTDYAASAVCGSCVELTGPKGTIKIRIVDQCPECKPGDIDLSPMAFDLMAEHAQGRVKIAWHYIPCQVPGAVVYHFKDGSNPYWTAVQIRNHRYAIKSFAYKTKDGSFKDVARLDYNYFVDDKGMGPGPFTFRVTDVYGHVIEDAGIPLKDNADSPGANQFPACTGQ